MRLAFFLRPKADSAIILCHTQASEATGSQLLCVAEGTAVRKIAFSLEDVEKRQGDGDFWQLALSIMEQGRDLVLEYRPHLSCAEAECPPMETVLKELEQCPCLLPLHILGTYRTMDAMPGIIVLFAVQGNRAPEPLRQTDILENVPKKEMEWMLFACPAERNISGKRTKFTDMSGLLRVNPSLEKRLDNLVENWKAQPDLSHIPLEQGNDWMEKIASSLHMIRLDRFVTSGNTRKTSSLTWMNDVFPTVLGTRTPFSASGNWPPILAGSMLERAFSPENKDALFFSDEGSIRNRLRHIILQGAAGTGKSTLGRLLLLHEILRDSTSRVVYMGPTRMLVEENHTAFCTLVEDLSRQGFEDIPSDKIVISTGEHIENDKYIQNGDFRALFIVYEKLNNFFHDTNLIRQVNCVMVDEVQMMCDPVRGGILDIVISSLCHEANRRFDIETDDLLRIIVCTTENFDLNDRFTLKVDTQEKRRSPLIFEDREAFCKLSTWFQFRIHKKMHSFPRDLNLLHEKKMLGDHHPYLQNIPKSGGNELNLNWLNEWMWGHEKVLYISSNMPAMMKLAKQLGIKRPDVAMDKEVLSRFHEELLQKEFNKQYCDQFVEYAHKGIFFNFSNMGYAARKTSAQMYRDYSYKKGIPVITFATSGIMYGVNLPADLMILQNLVWPCATIDHQSYDNSLFGRSFRYLRSYEIYNMAGRVGRQGIYNDHIVPTVVLCNFYPKKQQKKKFQEFIEELLSSKQGLSFVLDRKKTPQRLADFSSTQQRFLINCLLHSVEQENECSLDKVQSFIESTWAWNQVQQEHETEIWKKYIAQFFSFLQEEFPESVRVSNRKDKIMLWPLPFAYSVCQTGSNLSTLKELKNLLKQWNIHEYPPSAHALIVLLALVMTTESWIIFWEFHVEGRWGIRNDDDTEFRLREQQEEHIKNTEAEEKCIEDELKDILRNFMDEKYADAAIMHMKQVLEEKELPMYFEKNYTIPGIEKRKTLMTFRSALAILVWCCGGKASDISRYRYADGQNPKDLIFNMFFEFSFKENFRMRFFYTLNCFYTYCVECKFNKNLTEAVEAANKALMQSQKLVPVYKVQLSSYNTRNKKIEMDCKK